MATYYVDSATGNDLDDGLSEANAWATIDKAMNSVTVGGGDHIYVKASATYSETPTIDTPAGVAAENIFEGYTTTPGDGGQVTIDGATNSLADSQGSTANYYVFKNFIFTGGTGAGVSLSISDVVFKNCKFNSNTGAGLSCTGSRYVVEACEASDNGSSGIALTNDAIIVGCRAFRNAARGIDITDNGVVVGCECFSNVTENIRVGGTLSLGVVINCTTDGDGDDSDYGVLLAGSGPRACINTILYDNAVGLGGNSWGERLCSRNNLRNANTTNYDGGANTFTGEVTTAPSFTNEGTNDYRLAGSSPALAAGFDASTVAAQTSGCDIGAFQSAGSGGGGGGVGGAVGILTGGKL